MPTISYAITAHNEHVELERLLNQLDSSIRDEDEIIVQLDVTATEEVKKVVWINLHTLCMMAELLKPKELQDQERVKILNTQIYKERGMEEKEYHCCTNSSCISQYKLHIESDNLQESEKFN